MLLSSLSPPKMAFGRELNVWPGGSGKDRVGDRACSGHICGPRTFLSHLASAPGPLSACSVASLASGAGLVTIWLVLAPSGLPCCPAYSAYSVPGLHSRMAQHCCAFCLGPAWRWSPSLSMCSLYAPHRSSLCQGPPLDPSGFWVLLSHSLGKSRSPSNLQRRKGCAESWQGSLCLNPLCCHLSSACAHPRGSPILQVGPVRVSFRRLP